MTETRTGRHRAARIAFQVTAFLGGLALLGWCASVALGEENQQALDRLRQASAGQILLLMALSAATLALNGTIFWATLRPHRRLGLTGVLATNAIATFLSYLPFKLGVLSRVLIHNRRDRVPLLEIGAWFAAVAVILLASLGLLAGLALWRPQLDMTWIGIAVVGLAIAWTVIVTGGGLLAGEPGLRRIHALLDRPVLHPLAPLTRTPWFGQLHAGFAMLACPRMVAMTIVLRVLDVAVQAWRFVIAARIIGMDLGYDRAVLIALTYFMISILSPAGTLGTREAGATGLAKLLAITGSGRVAVIALLVSATEALVNLAGAGLGVAWLRPDRLLRNSGQSSAPSS
jgi:hypothetical protein